MVLDPNQRVDDSRAAAPSEFQKFRWQKAGVIIAALALVITLVRFFSDRDATPSTVGVHGTVPAASVVGPVPSASLSPASSSSSVHCRTTSGNVVACEAPGAGLVTKLGECTVIAATLELGVDPAVRPLDLKVASLGATCLVTPGDIAAEAGALAEDLRRFDPDYAGKFTVCSVTAQGPQISCIQPHRVEYIGVWSSARTIADSGGCGEIAAKYTGRRFTDPNDVVQVGLFANAQHLARCAIVSSVDLTDSMWRWGSQPLPTSRR